MSSSGSDQMPEIRRGFWTPRRVARIAILIALSGVGALIKIPSPTGTVALDSAPGYFTAVALGPVEGGIVAGLGHMFTALTTGFPLGLPLHLFVCVQQAVWALAFWFIATRIKLWIGIVVAIFLNGIVASALVIPVGGVGLAVSLIPPLTVGSTVNIFVASAAYKTVQRSNLI